MKPIPPCPILSGLRLPHWLVIGILTLASLSPAQAQEVSAALGRLHAVGEKVYTYSWQFQYQQALGPDWTASLSWLNEGHLPGHHRDGASLQLWRTHRMEHNALRLSAGLGTYRTFDTTEGGDGKGFQNQHGIKPLLSLRAQYPIPGRSWEVFMQLNRAFDGGQPQTQALLAGINWRIVPTPGSTQTSARHPAPGTCAAQQEWTFLFGRTILNSFESESTDFLQSFSLDYRRRVARHVDLSIGYSDEGGIGSVKRDGLAVQAWITTRPQQGKWLLGFGLGPYVSRVFPDRSTDEPATTVNVRVSPLYSMVLGRHLWGHWAARLQWNRTSTRNHRDTDVLLTGLAYSWN